MHSHALNRCRQIFVIGENGPAVAIATQRLGRKETCCGGKADASDPPPMILRPKALGRIAQYPQFMRRADGLKQVVFGGQPEQINDDRTSRAKAVLSRGCDCRLETVGVPY